MSKYRPDGFPRRNDITLCTPAENAIRAAVDAVEEAGAHPLLTDAVNLLDEAREKVADFVDNVPRYDLDDLGLIFTALERNGLMVRLQLIKGEAGKGFGDS